MRALACALVSPLPSLLLAASLLQTPATMNDSRHGGILKATLVAHEQADSVRDAHAGGLQETTLAQPLASIPRSRAVEVEATDSDQADQVIDARQFEDEGVAYLPAAQLTERPQPLQDIAPDWAEPGAIPPPLNGILLINEYGDVDRVLLDERGLTSAQQWILRERFLAARFVPGKLYGRPVRTALRIEIRFD